MDRRSRPEPAPITPTAPVVLEWLARRPHDTAHLAQELAWSPTFTDQSFPPGHGEVADLWLTGADVSWLGGPAVLPLEAWPRNAAGAPLAHVATVALADVAGAAQEEEKRAFPRHDEGLPTGGALEVFHDLLTHGWEAGDRDDGGWCVRWVPRPERSGFAAPPADLSTPTEACQAGIFLPGWTLPPSEDVVGGDPRWFAAAEDVTREHRRAWAQQRRLTGPERAGEHLVTTTHVYGHGQHDRRTAEAVLAEVLPLTEGDEHRLVLDVEGWTHLDGWFGDVGSLEVWMRAGDLAARRFDAAWCLIRTD